MNNCQPLFLTFQAFYSIEPYTDLVICPVLLRFNNNEDVDLSKVILELEDAIVESYPIGKKIEDFKGDWVNRIVSCAKLLNLKLKNTNASFKAIKRKICNTNTALSTYEDSASTSVSVSVSVLTATTTTTTTASTASTTSTTTKKSPLKEPFTEALKERFISNFNKLDKDHFWYLDSTQTTTADDQLVSVEEKLFNYGLKCQYLHPIHSFILDLGDTTLEAIFTKKELLKLQEFGKTMLVHPLEESISLELTKMGEMTNTLQVYDYFRKLDFNPISNPLMAWLSMSITNTCFNFLSNERLPVTLESDNMYLYRNFLNSICYYSKIQSISKEKSSQANSNATNSKRKLSSIEEIARKAAGRKMDSVYLGAELELGALEIGSKNSDTKDLSDGYYKLPIVMKDMLKDIVDKYTSLRNDINIIGYNIQDNKLSYMNMDAPAGYITRIRRLQKLPYPTSKDDYIARMPALLTIAYNGFETMNNTLSKIQSCKSQIAPIILADDDFLLPPTIKSTSTSTSTSTSASSSRVSKIAKTSNPTVAS